MLIINNLEDFFKHNNYEMAIKIRKIPTNSRTILPHCIKNTAVLWCRMETNYLSNSYRDVVRKLKKDFIFIQEFQYSLDSWVSVYNNEFRKFLVKYK